MRQIHPELVINNPKLVIYPELVISTEATHSLIVSRRAEKSASLLQSSPSRKAPLLLPVSTSHKPAGAPSHPSLLEA
jgi:hypothetical protein